MQDFEQRRNQAQLDAARSFYTQGNYKACQQQAESLLVRAPGLAVAQQLLIETHLKSGDLSAAQEAVTKAVETHPDDATFAELQGRLYEAAGREPQALAAFERAARLRSQSTKLATGSTANSSNSSQVVTSRAETSAAGKSKADKPLSRAHHQDQSTRAALFKAEAALALGEYEQSAEFALWAVDQTPDHAAARYQAGRALEAAGQLNDAVEQYARAAQLAPEEHIYAESRRRLASTLEPAVNVARVSAESESNITTIGKSAADKSLARPESNRATSVIDDAMESESEVALRRGEAALAGGAIQSAQHFLTTAVKASTHDQTTACAAAILALRYEQPEMAAELASLALQGHPRSATLYRIQGTASYRRGDYRSARTALERSLDIDRSQALSHFLLAATLEKLGQTEPAEEHYRRAHAMDARYARP
jgi:tetratricopeptide (TPR) repeat protein